MKFHWNSLGKVFGSENIKHKFCYIHRTEVRDFLLSFPYNESEITIAVTEVPSTSFTFIAVT